MLWKVYEFQTRNVAFCRKACVLWAQLAVIALSTARRGAGITKTESPVVVVSVGGVPSQRGEDCDSLVH
jgi:hypothetical protein